ncbi:hypothetical protein GCM10018779_50660 [Streptomyces griseocarneus]|nr:hypothetical protein GCM10018779_50660 [Streptomyces griseocarneus]
MFEPQLIDAAGQARIGKAGLRDERRELTVGDALWGSFRHQPAGLPDLCSWNGVNLAAPNAPIATFAPHSSDRVRTDQIPPGRSPPKITGRSAGAAALPAPCGFAGAPPYSGKNASDTMWFEGSKEKGSCRD